VSSLSVELPARWGFWQRLKNTALYYLIRTAAAGVRRVPPVLCPAIATVLGTLAFGVAYKERRRAMEQLAFALPEVNARATCRHMFIHLARCVLELGHLPQLLEETPLTDAQRALLDAAFAEGRGIVAVTGHIGNWEFLAQVLAKAGYPVSAIAKPLYDPRLTQWIDAERSANGGRIIWRGETGAARDMLRVFRQNGLLALLIDQDTKVEGAFVPFFSRPAFTPTGAAQLALRMQAPMIVMWTHRDAHGRHQVPLDRLIPPNIEATAQAVITLTADLTARLEQAIRMQPAQWVWIHPRWKRQPIESKSTS